MHRKRKAKRSFFLFFVCGVKLWKCLKKHKECAKINHSKTIHNEHGWCLITSYLLSYYTFTFLYWFLLSRCTLYYIFLYINKLMLHPTLLNVEFLLCHVCLQFEMWILQLKNDPLALLTISFIALSLFYLSSWRVQCKTSTSRSAMTSESKSACR